MRSEDDVAAILEYIAARPEIPAPWPLASSPTGAKLAARLGLPLAFAYHIRPQATSEALESYREEFRPSRWGDAPCVMLCVRAICAETEAAAEALARPIEAHRAALATHRVDQPLYDVRTAAAHVFTPEETKVVDETRGYQIQGTPEIVRARLTELAKRFRVDELIVVTPIAEAKDRARAIELIMAGGM